MGFSFKPVAKEDVPELLKKAVTPKGDYERDKLVEIPDDDGHFTIMDDNGNVIGRLVYPNVLCPGMSCAASDGKRHPFSFRHDVKHDRWVHVHCGRPSQMAWENAWHGMVETDEGFTPPWTVGPTNE